MKIVVTSADSPLGALLCRGLGRTCEVLPVGLEEQPRAAVAGYRRADLRAPEQVAPLLEGAQAIVHALPYEPPALPEGELLDLAARSTYVLVKAACQAGVRRVVLLSRLSLLEDYPRDYALDPNWAPRPRLEAGSLAPYMAELVCREIARTGRIEVVCLRLGSIEAPEGTSAGDAVKAVEEALDLESDKSDKPGRGHNWGIRHVASTGRFARRKERN